jgi:hypothetical protein
VTFDGKQQSEMLKSAWSQYIEELPLLRKYENFTTFLDKHVRDREERTALKRRIRTILSGKLPREQAEVLLVRFFVRLGEAVAMSYDRLSPSMFLSLQSAPNSQVMRFPTKEVLDAIYNAGKGS